MGEGILSEYAGMNYKKYLKSPHWKDVRKRFYASEFYSGRCECCFDRNVPLQVHHKSYKRLGRERLSDLVALCGDCHKKTHEIVGGRITLWDASAIVRTRIQKKLCKKQRREIRSSWNKLRANVLIPCSPPSTNK